MRGRDRMQTRARTRQALIAATLTLLCFVSASMAHAHPHVWVTMEAEILFDKDKSITGFRYKWSFDEFYTSFAIQGLDKNGDGVYSREELQEPAEANIASLKEFEYFTFPKVVGIVAERQPPRDYYLDYIDGILSLHFTIPLVKPIPADQIKNFSLAVYDPSFYIDFALAKTSPIRLTGAPSGCTPAVKEPQPQQVTVQSLSEAFFSNADAAANLAVQYAKTITITCPNS
jgi:ABC-type uncharacterized transport system substrate-binding protein